MPYPSNTENYAEGRRDGFHVSDAWGLVAADEFVADLMALDNHSLYALAFEKAVSKYRMQHTI